VAERQRNTKRSTQDGRASDRLPIDGGGKESKQSRPRSEEVIDVAAELFRRKGFLGTSTQDLADALGMLKGSLYYYIDSKDDLLFAVMQSSHDHIQQRLAEAKNETGPVVDRLHRFIVRNLESNIADPDKSAVFSTEFRYLSRERQSAVLALRDQYEHFVRSLLEEGQASGAVCASLDPRVATAGVLSMVNAVVNWYRPSGRTPRGTVISNLAEMAVRSVQCGRDCTH